MIGGMPLRRISPLLVAVLLTAACGGGKAERETGGLPTGSLVIETSEGVLDLTVEIAETPSTRTRGLMFRKQLEDDTGMVFLAEEPTASGFWMKNTLIPLSVAFWDNAGRILAILDMEPCDRDPCRVYDPQVTWTMAVEVNQGWFEEHFVAVGDRVRLWRSP